MIVGFIGPREGLPPCQHDRLKDVIRKLSFTSFIHRGEMGADTLAHYAVRAAKGDRFPIYVLPGDNRGTVVTVPMDSDIILRVNGIMIRIIHCLISTVVTGSIIDKAVKKGVPILFIKSDGSVAIERNDET